MPRRESLMEMAERHVREGAERIARQRALIDRLAERGLPIYDAVVMLQAFEAAQREHIAHLQFLRNSA
ncbi:hypothetical protein EN827_01110 [Mesorhizobium sp. M1D.F.Ca.ET.184.01.1.1]|nr:hypothetical protein EN874_001110 [Mesorhizobium sp. M1D.F.Ca.ET.231.01.1.1]TGP38269.1 hypothetical protein EN877_01110 [Mesorhizobium sp. M1D.F.Ca.ET.234.01.1.1]TGS50480.1 hypothetical protein EN827_01110 [Mesorhizobium sp. M1D.F.Ca.ET.184.01.1.1]TGS66366.1 hypothetical protein EN826_001110 [Mesorhizobium sp. M1D.F.Ca.ET.183.01.1.1]